MTPILYYKSQALMRLAFTQACVNFPRLNVIPVSNAVYQVYANVAYSLGSTYTLLDPDVAEDVLDLTSEAAVQLVSSDSMKKMMNSVAPEDRSLAKMYCSGLDPVLGMEMLRYARTYRKDKFEIVRRRKLMLSDRRNSLANSFTDQVVQRAQQRLVCADRGGAHA
jgi:hypothetical protein